MGAIVSLCCEEQDRQTSKTPKAQPKPKSPVKQEIAVRQKAQAQQQESKMQSTNQLIINHEQGNESQQFYEIQSFIDEQQKAMMQPRHISLNYFEILGQLGEGSFGSVLQVKCIEGNQCERDIYYAMKVIPKQKLNSSKSMACAKLQRQILGKIYHPFITNLKFAFVDKNNFYLVMENASYGDLSKLILAQSSRNFLKLHCKDYIRFIAANVIFGLECLHQESIIYRDLKLENVLIFKNGYVKLSDFGLSKVLSNLDQKRRTNAGTAIYQAPEMVLQLGYNWAVDLWALGILIYELQTGLTPFKIQDVSTKIRFKRVVKEEEINRKWRGCPLQDDLRDLIASLLKYSPQQRLGYSNFSQLKNHQYFKSIFWPDIYQHKIQSPLLLLVEKNHKTNQQNLLLPPQQKLILKQSSFLQSIPIHDDWNFNYKQKSCS